MPTTSRGAAPLEPSTVDDTVPNASGDRWSTTEHARLLVEVPDGLRWDDIAALHGRTVSAIRQRCGLMVAEDPEDPMSRGKRAEKLRTLLADDPDYDWASPMQANQKPGQHMWTASDEDQLLDAWAARTPLTELVATFGASETAIVRHLVVMRVATGLVEVTDRLGCRDGGSVDTRRILATDPAFTPLSILVGWDASNGAPAHVSLHLNANGAEQVKREDTTGLTWGTWTCTANADLNNLELT
jgi:hypothetical protein